ncbi:Peptidase C39 family protein, partial [Variovorax sp. YR750]|uniref:cysteine peptidase family C39 domain-containing protein n=1 Tax=Variovorax sp. YR750 TaxID=1884384 RepID=UPI0008B5DC74
MGVLEAAVQPQGEEGARPQEAPDAGGAANPSLVALCTLARFHQIAADASLLSHQLGLVSSESVDTATLLRAAKHLGLKAKSSRTTLDRLSLTPLPALAALRGEDGSERFVILAQCDAQRVLLQDPSSSNGRPVIEPLEVFASHWSGELILITSRASLAGELARFDFSWFIPSLVKHRKLLGEVLFISFIL